MFVNCMNSAVW